MGWYSSVAPTFPAMGVRTTDGEMCAKTVDDTRQQDLPASFARSTAFTVASEQITSCMPSLMSPPVSHASCLPAWSSKHPATTHVICHPLSEAVTIDKGAESRNNEQHVMSNDACIACHRWMHTLWNLHRNTLPSPQPNEQPRKS
jgi:hypothetical protein